MDLKEQIDKLTNQLAQKKAQQLLKEGSLKRRAEIKARAERNRRIYKLGGMVEKMGLANLDEALFLGILEKDYNRLKITTSQDFEAVRSKGREFLPNGKKLAPLNL